MKTEQGLTMQTYTEHMIELNKIHRRSDKIRDYYKEQVNNINKMYQLNICTINELTRLLSKVAKEHNEAMTRIHREINELPDYVIQPLTSYTVPT